MNVIGIDLGTTNSCVALLSGGVPSVVRAPDGSRTIPSVVSWRADGSILVGGPAKRGATAAPLDTVQSVKRVIGRKGDELPDEMGVLASQVVVEDNVVNIKAGGKLHSPQAISAHVLESLKQQVEVHTGEVVDKAVITVPAYFNDEQRQATIEAGKIAGLEVLRIINEPTAAALAYGVSQKGDSDKPEKVFVFDLGGGTFDVSVLDVEDGVFEVLATAGDNRLGGDDFDAVLALWIFAEIEGKHGLDLREDIRSRSRVLEAAEKAKRDLSGATITSIDLPYVGQDDSGNPVHYSGEITRAQFEALIAPLLERLNGPIRQVMTDSGLSASELTSVIMVGGMTRVPAVTQHLTNMLGREPSRAADPDESIALGAAIQASIITGEAKGLLLIDVNPLSLGIETRGGVFTTLIKRNSPLPIKVDEVFTTAEDDQSNVEIHILQGERPLASDNRSITRIYLSDIPPAPRGTPQIQVTFELTEDGVLFVRAHDLGTKQEKHLRIETSSSLEENDLKRLVEEAEARREEDAKRLEEVRLRNETETLAYQSERLLRLWSDKLPVGGREQLADSIYRIRTALSERVGREQLNELQQELQEIVHRLTTVLYAEGVSPSADEPVDTPFELE